jgi:hypothetical protein
MSGKIAVVGANKRQLMAFPQEIRHFAQAASTVATS